MFTLGFQQWSEVNFSFSSQTRERAEAGKQPSCLLRTTKGLGFTLLPWFLVVPQVRGRAAPGIAGARESGVWVNWSVHSGGLVLPWGATACGQRVQIESNCKNAQ